MCDKLHFEKLRDKVSELERNDAAQSEQIKTLFATTSKISESLSSTFNKVLWAFIVVLLLAILGLIYGAVGERGFNSVTKAMKDGAYESTRR